MSFRWSLRDYKENEGSTKQFPGERRSLDGRFCGSETRLVHVDTAGKLQEYSYPLSGYYGITATRFGVRDRGSFRWLDESDSVSQEYLDGSNLVETVHETGDTKVVQRDLTVGSTHDTSFELRGEYSSSAAIIALFEFSPEGQEGRVGQLLHDGVVEIYHNDEHDYITASTELAEVVPQIPERLGEILSTGVQTYPRSLDTDSYEESRLTGRTCLVAPVEDGEVTISNTVTDISSTSREAAVTELRDHAARVRSSVAIESTADDRSSPLQEQFDEPVATDLRVLDLLSARTGARIAGPDFDPFYQYSGGYGYTWFRDDSEIAKFLLEADRLIDLDLDDTHRKSARFYVQTQLDDGRWPHRVWAMNGRLAPGWANGHIEGDDRHYQADQTASVLVFLASYLDHAGESLPSELQADVRAALASGVDGLNKSLEEDGLPAPCENAWENMKGRFTHTAAGFLHAYSAIADAPLDPELRARAKEQADRVYRAIDELWVDDEELYALRLSDGELDARIDVSTATLIDAHLTYSAIADLDPTRLDRLRKHLETMFDRLWKETDKIRGLTRFEADTWRRQCQDSEKVWTVATGWGAYAAEKSIALFHGSEEGFDPLGWSGRLYREIDLGGSLCLPSGYLPEQFFDTGEPDSATPLGWPHAIRLVTFALQETRDSRARIGQAEV